MWKNDLEWLQEINKLKQERNDAITIATIFQKAYLRLGGRTDPYCTSLLYKEAFKKLEELKELQYLGMKDCCEEPRGMIGCACDNCGGLVIPIKD